MPLSCKQGNIPCAQYIINLLIRTLQGLPDRCQVRHWQLEIGDFCVTFLCESQKCNHRVLFWMNDKKWKYIFVNCHHPVLKGYQCLWHALWPMCLFYFYSIYCRFLESHTELCTDYFYDKLIGPQLTVFEIDINAACILSIPSRLCLEQLHSNHSTGCSRNSRVPGAVSLRLKMSWL